MIIVGKVSGIQQFLFATSEAGGGQAKRLRARSFLISLVAEIAAIRVLRALGWPMDDAHYLLHGAGKFVVSGDGRHDAQDLLAGERQFISSWLARQTNGELQFALAAGAAGASPVASYREAQAQLHLEKSRPWAPDPTGSWEPNRLVLDPLDTPCSLCGRARATEDEQDPDTGERRRVCRWCATTRRLGRQLPRGRLLVIRDAVADGDLDLLGCGVRVLQADSPPSGNSVIAIANLQSPERRPDSCPPDRFLQRRLMAYVPAGSDGSPLDFAEIASRATGDNLLGVLVADADSIGVALESSLAGQSTLASLTDFSHSLDMFFAGFLRTEIERPASTWREIYTVFSGGDDLVMVGPWNVMFEFAGELQRWFHGTFGERDLTLSAGLAVIKPRRPVKAAVAEAERLLERAKTEAGPGEATPKNQLAALGQIWKWEHHRAILQSARRLVGWVEGGQMERGWLHTLLEFIEARHPHIMLGVPRTRAADPLATARLTHNVSRNYRRGSDARRWADALIREFDEPTRPSVRYLPAALRYALTATRTVTDKE